jgi:hypothetical protein
VLAVSSRLGRRRSSLDEHLVDQAVLAGIFRRHEVVALGVRARCCLDRLAGVLGQDAR